jgi:hypothetical protein
MSTKTSKERTVKQMRTGETGYVTSWTTLSNGMGAHVSVQPRGTADTRVVRTFWGFRFVHAPNGTKEKLERFFAWFDQGSFFRILLAQWLILGLTFSPVFIGGGISNLTGVDWPMYIGMGIFIAVLFFLIIPGMLGAGGP